MKLYVELMAEVKVRLHVTSQVASGQLPMPTRMAREFCYLQLRMICELIAVSCLLLHGDIEAARGKDITKEWNAADLMARLEGLHPKFFPTPASYSKEGTAGHFEPVKSEYLTKAELLRLYGRSGDILHRGNLRHLMKEEGEPVAPLPEITEWAKKILLLLHQHYAVTLDESRAFVCVMHNPGDGRVVLFQADAEEMPPLSDEADPES
jgi:hypothetical protein